MNSRLYDALACLKYAAGLAIALGCAAGLVYPAVTIAQDGSYATGIILLIAFLPAVLLSGRNYFLAWSCVLVLLSGSQGNGVGIVFFSAMFLLVFRFSGEREAKI